MPAVGGAVRWLTDFRGRTTAQQFWPYAIGALVVAFAVMSLGMMSFTIRELGGESDSPWPWALFAGAMAGGVLTGVILLAAPVVRRLRDARASPWWGLAPPVFLTLSTGGAGFEATRSSPGGVHSFWAVGVMAGSGAAYLASLAVILVLLCRPSRPAPTPGR